MIIEKTSPIINTKGYGNTSLSDIMQATGMAKGGIYGRFGTKEAIGEAVFEYNLGKVVNALGEATGKEKTIRGKLCAILDFYRDYSNKPLIEGGCPVINTSVEADDHLPTMKPLVAGAIRDMITTLERLIGKGIKEGEFSEKLDVALEARKFYAGINGAMMMSRATDDHSILRSITNDMRTKIMNW